VSAGLALAFTGVLVAALSVLSGLRRLFVVTVHGGSMEPGLRDGDRLLARRVTVAALRRGDVVVLERPDDELRWTGPPHPRATARADLLIKRVAALPGDPPPRDAVPALADHPAALVPPNHLVALGDNHHSLDSKQIGYFPADRLLGVVLRPLR
jgi:signal peptidase I